MTTIAPSRAVLELRYGMSLRLLTNIVSNAFVDNPERDYIKVANLDGKLVIVLYPPTVHNLTLLYNTVAKDITRKWAEIKSSLEGGLYTELDYSKGIYIGTGVIHTAFVLSGTLLSGACWRVGKDLPIITRIIETAFAHPEFEWLNDFGSYLEVDLERWVETMKHVLDDDDKETHQLAFESYLDVVDAINECLQRHIVKKSLRKWVDKIRPRVWAVAFPDDFSRYTICICGMGGVQNSGAF